MKTLTLAAAAALLVLCLGVPASAQPGPAGAWNIALSVDSGSANPDPLIQELCLFPDGSWSGPGFPAGPFWVGLWYYTGGPVRLLGNFGTDGAVAMELTLVNGQSMFGTLTQWRGKTNSQTSVSWARAVFTRKERCWMTK